MRSVYIISINRLKKLVDIIIWIALVGNFFFTGTGDCWWAINMFSLIFV